MGKAEAPLPDPLSSPSPTTAAGADDLLSQLAGDEIDRLLAEAEVDDAPATQAHDIDAAIASAADELPGLTNPDPADAPVLSDAAQDAMRLLDDVQKNADEIEQGVADLAGAEPLADSPAPDAPNASPSINSELDDLFKQLNDRPAPVAPVVQPSEPVAEKAIEDARPLDEQADAPDDGIAGEAEIAAGERAGLGLADLASSYAGATSPQPGRDADAALPLLLRPLEWLSAPLDAAPDTVRDMMGKAAIITFVNAAAVILYVLIFKK